MSMCSMDSNVTSTIRVTQVQAIALAGFSARSSNQIPGLFQVFQVNFDQIPGDILSVKFFRSTFNTRYISNLLCM